MQRLARSSIYGKVSSAHRGYQIILFSSSSRYSSSSLGEIHSSVSSFLTQATTFSLVSCWHMARLSRCIRLSGWYRFRFILLLRVCHGSYTCRQYHPIDGAKPCVRATIRQANRRALIKSFQQDLLLIKQRGQRMPEPSCRYIIIPAAHPGQTFQHPFHFHRPPSIRGPPDEHETAAWYRYGHISFGRLCDPRHFHPQWASPGISLPSARRSLPLMAAL